MPSLAKKRFRFPAPPFGPSQVRQVDDLRGPAGRLEAVLNTGAADAPMVAVVCHPYPPAGGSLHNKVVYHAAKAFSSLGLPVLRFNFRGVGRSEGEFDGGQGEQDDVRAALAWASNAGERPVLLGGFSFGGYVALQATCDRQEVAGRFALGLPWESGGRAYRYPFLAACRAPLLIVNGGEDPFMPLAPLRELKTMAPAQTRVEVIAGAEHFFQGVEGSPEPKLAEMQRLLVHWVRTTFQEIEA